RDADDTRRVAQEEGDLLWCRELGGHDEVALVLAVGVVDDDHDLTFANGGDGVLDPGERHAQSSLASRRSAYLASRSTSRLTWSPGRRRPRVVTSAVCGMTATVKPSSRVSTTVRLQPSTAMEPLGTM